MKMIIQNKYRTKLHYKGDLSYCYRDRNKEMKRAEHILPNTPNGLRGHKS